jgi:hypothetical protein
VSVLLVSLAYGIVYWHKKPEIKPPIVRLNDWSARFNKAEKLEEHWQYPKGFWSTEAGELSDSNQDDQALLVRGQEMGIPSDLDGKVFRNFRAVFKVRFKTGAERAAWVLRAQPDRAGGYLFELVREGPNLFLYSWIYERQQKGEKLGQYLVPFGKLRETKSLSIDVVVDDYKFNYNIKFADDQPDGQNRLGEPTSGEMVVKNLEIKDDPDNVRWPFGTIGFLVTDDKSVMRVESIYVYPMKP